MIKVSTRKDQKLAVFGLGTSGIAAARALIDGGARVSAWDDDAGSRDAAARENVPLSEPIAYTWSDADALILSGAATGAPTDLQALRSVRQAVPDRPLWIGSGVDARTVAESLKVADAVIVGTSLKRGGRTQAPLNSAKVKAFVKAAAP